MMESCELPEHLIQLIQSLLTSKQAARSALLSKSWLSAFKTRPNLDFDQADFLRRGVPFSAHVHNTVTRYAESNLKIHSFTISAQSIWNFHQTIRKALENGATRLSVQSQSDDFYVPKGVLESETLVSLTLKGAIIYRLDQEVTCSRLESLCLENVVILGRDLFPRIISACPLIQNLSLLFLVDFDTSFLGDLSSSSPVLKDLTLRMQTDYKGMLISSCSLERLEIKLLKYRFWHRDSRFQGIRFDLPSIRVSSPLKALWAFLYCLFDRICVWMKNSRPPPQKISIK